MMHLDASCFLLIMPNESDKWGWKHVSVFDQGSGVKSCPAVDRSLREAFQTLEEGCLAEKKNRICGSGKSGKQIRPSQPNLTPFAAFGPFYEPPMIENLCYSCLSKEKARIEKTMALLQDSCPHTGTDDDGSDSVFTSVLTDSVIEVVPSNVHQIISHPGSIGESFEAIIRSKFPYIFWSTFASHSLQLLMEDITKPNWITQRVMGRSLKESSDLLATKFAPSYCVLGRVEAVETYYSRGFQGDVYNWRIQALEATKSKRIDEGYTLNPKYFGEGQSKDKTILRAWKATSEIYEGDAAEESVGEEDAVDCRDKMDPVAWRENFGFELPYLQTLAIRILYELQPIITRVRKTFCRKEASVDTPFLQVYEAAVTPCLQLLLVDCGRLSGCSGEQDIRMSCPAVDRSLREAFQTLEEERLAEKKKRIYGRGKSGKRIRPSQPNLSPFAAFGPLYEPPMIVTLCYSSLSKEEARIEKSMALLQNFLGTYWVHCRLDTAFALTYLFERNFELKQAIEVADIREEWKQWRLTTPEDFSNIEAAIFQALEAMKSKGIDEGYTLNPKYFGKGQSKDRTIMRAWKATLERYEGDATEGSMGKEDAVDCRDKMDPVAWWENFGFELSYLQTLPMRILCEEDGFEFAFRRNMKAMQVNYLSLNYSRTKQPTDCKSNLNSKLDAGPAAESHIQCPIFGIVRTLHVICLLGLRLLPVDCGRLSSCSVEQDMTMVLFIFYLF
ncbi:protein of unknown function DUF659 [Dillenia turbinata]|uniref:DUF659 domain-containing protein n=1 Tax=Dillenia turbinata TaxID=194707 RepID=A0AAN8V195_9MAGN